MNPYIKKYIITGAPGTGKTTLINALDKQYPCMHEVSRRVITDEQENGENGTPWQDVNRFVELVYKASVNELDASPHSLLTDRSVLDLVAYLQIEDKAVPGFLDNFPYHYHYEKSVIFAPTWKAIYHQDYQRQQDFIYCLELEEILIDTYKKKGFKLHTLPKTSVSDRFSFVQQKLFNINDISSKS